MPDVEMLQQKSMCLSIFGKKTNIQNIVLILTDLEELSFRKGDIIEEIKKNNLQRL